MVNVKICGITNKDDAVEAVKAGADMLGFVFYSKSARFVTPAQAREIGSLLPPSAAKVGVFVDEDKKSVLKMAAEAGLDMLQLHGSETPEYCASLKKNFKVMKAFRVRSAKDLEAASAYDTDYYLFDSYNEEMKGGTGETFDWGLFRAAAVARPFILSGGLNPENVADAVKTVKPYGVDVSTGVEKAPGKKDKLLMKRFIENARQVS